MAKTRDVHGVVDRRRNGVAFACDQRGGDGAAVARNDSANATVDGVTKSLDRSGRAQAPVPLNWRLDGLDGTEHEAGRADTLEVEITGEIVAAGAQRRERRAQARAKADVAADWRRRALAYGDADAIGFVAEAGAFELDCLHDDAIRAVALLAGLDKTLDQYVAGRKFQNRMGDLDAFECSDCKSG